MSVLFCFVFLIHYFAPGAGYMKELGRLAILKTMVGTKYRTYLLL